ncbi:MAG: SUMF1/EgtB/PvdO family nonheme iron enzyme [Sulfurimonas sp.]|nr:SUMF1/EgtB/PvdO family nonheme iron enzyme [Sulfurimonas sp.]
MCRYKKLSFIYLFFPLVTLAFENAKVEIVPQNLAIPQLKSKLAFETSHKSFQTQKPFYIQKYEVSKRNFFEFAKEYSKHHKKIENMKTALWLEKYDYYDEDDALLPVTKVSFDIAGKYCKSIDARLPTQQEWILAAITPTKIGKYQNKESVFIAYPTIGYESAQEKMDNYLTTVDLSIESANGLFGMMGNVWEMTTTLYEGEDDKIVIKGGSYKNREDREFFDVRFVNFIYRSSKSYEYEHIGFRCAYDKQ